MRKIYKVLSIVLCGMISSNELNAQAINEGFSSVATLTASGWAQQNLSTPVGTSPKWIQGVSAIFPAFSNPDTTYALCTYNSIAGTGTISNWLFAPNRTFSNGDVIKFYSRTVATPAYPDRLELRISLNGASVNAGATSTSVGDFTTLALTINPSLTTAGYPNTWTQYSYTITGLASPTSGRAAFRYFVTNGGPTGTNSDNIGIDNFEYIPFGSASPDVTASKYGEYTIIPLLQVNPMALQTTINNIGSASTPDAKVIVNVYQGPNYTTPIQSYTSTPATIAAGGTLAVNVGTYTPTMLGDYEYRFITSCTGNTITSADTAKYRFSVVSNEYARDNGVTVQSVGAGNTISVIIGSTFKINTTTFMDSVLFFCNPGTAGLGDTVRIRIANTTAGVPSNTGYVGASLIYRFTAANTNTATGAVITLPVKDLSNNRLSLTPGTYFVGIEKYVTSDNYGLGCTQDIFTANTVYANLNNGTYSPLNSLLAGFNYVPIIRPYLNSCAGTSITVNSGAICAGQSFTMAPNGATTYSYSSGSAIVTPTVNSTYTVTGTSTLTGCTNTAVSTVTLNALPVLTTTVTNVLCNGGATGAVTLTATGGASPYMYLASNGATVSAQSSLSPGVYTYTVIDNNSCVALNSFTVTQPSAINLSASANNTVVCEGNASTLTANATGGTGTQTYTWVAGSTANTNIVNPTVTSTYTVNASDANNCASTATVEVTVNALPTVMATTNNTLLCTGETATLTVSGTATSYTWSTTENTMNIAVSPTVQTTYTVDGTDANGCVNTTTIMQDVSLCTGFATIANTTAAINLYPNPTTGLFTVELTTESKIVVTNALGQIFVSETFEAGKHSLDIRNEATGVYFVKVIENNKQQIIKVVKQ